MASRVNVKFVVGLVAALVLVLAGVVFVGNKAIRKSGQELMREGDKFFAEGDFEKATSAYGRAVNKDQRNAEWLTKWVSTMEKTTPATQQAYTDRYFKEYLTALRALADSDRANLANQRRVLDEQLLLTWMEGSRLDGWEQLNRASEEIIKSWHGDAKGKNILRRYRGLAQVGIYRSNPDVKEDDLKPGYEDLLAALDADPKDEEVVMGVAVMENKMAEIARKRGADDEADKQMRQVKERLARFVADNPPAPMVAFQLIATDLSIAQQAARKSGLDSEALRAKSLEIAKTIETGMKPIVKAIKAMPSETIRPFSAIDIALTSSILLPNGMDNLPTGTAVALDLIDHIRSGHPKDAALLLYMSGTVARDRGEIEAADQLFKQIADLPALPLCLQGALQRDRKVMATSERISLAFARWETAKDLAKKEQAISEAIELRKQLTSYVAESSSSVLAASARIAMMKGDFMGARSLATQYNDQTNRGDVDMLLLEGEILRKMGNVGAAKEIFLRILQRDQTSLPALLRMAEIEMGQGNFSEARRYMATAAFLRPDVKEYKEKEKLITGLLNPNDSSNPSAKAIREAQRLTQGIGRDIPRAIDVLRKGLEQVPGDANLSVGLMTLLIQTNDRDGAKKVLDDAIIANPDNASIKRQRAALDNPDPVEGIFQQISELAIPDWQKELARYEVCMRVGKAAEGRAHLQSALKERPDDPTVVEMAFQDAAGRVARNSMDANAAQQAGKKDEVDRLKADQALSMVEAERLAAVAEAGNLDQVNGMLFRARIQVLKGNNDDAIRTLREVVAKDKVSLLGWRLLGMVLLETQQYQAGADALAKAVEINPNDLVAAKNYVKALFATRRIAEALTFARRVEANLGVDSDFAEILLQLEAVAPTGDPSRAITVRENLEKQEPSNVKNKYQLAALLIDAKRYDDAKKRISDLLKVDPMDAIAVQLDASCRGRQGDREGALKVYQDYLNAIPVEKRTEQPYMDASTTLGELGLTEAAEMVLNMGRKYQDPAVRKIDRQLGDMLFNAGKSEQAIAAYRRSLEVGTPEDIVSIRKRVVEAYERLGQYDKADVELQAIGPAGQKDPTVLLLAAENAVLQNDREKARRIYDQVVSIDPKNWLAFLKRGDFNRSDLSMVREVEQDYLQVLQINPQFNPARGRLAALYVENGKPDLAIEQFRQAIQMAPMDDQLRNAFIDLLVDRGRASEAVQAVEEIVKLRPDDAQWLFRGGMLAGRAGSPDKAADYFGALWKLRPGAESAVLYATALMNKTPPDLNGAAAVLESPTLDVNKSIQLRLTRARLMRSKQKMSEASKDVLEALALVDQGKRADASAFVSGLESVYPKQDEIIAALSRLEEKAPFRDWLSFQANLVRMRDRDSRSRIREAMQSLANGTGDAKLRGAGFGILGTLAMGDEDWAGAVEFFRKGTEIDPENAELLNNYAYLATTKLNKAADALPFAEKAVKLAPNTANFLDTLACVHIKLKNYDKAAEILSQAITVSTNDADRAPVLMHLAQARVGLGNRAEAKRLLQTVEQIFQGIPAVATNYDQDLKELRKSIDGQ